MQPGQNDFIEYTTSDDTVWTAELTEVHWHYFIPGTITDPDFVHRRIIPPPTNPYETEHHDNAIKFLTADGTTRIAKVHCHTNNGVNPIETKFEYTHGASGDQPQLVFKDRNGTWWLAVVDLMHVGEKAKPRFNVRNYP